MNIQRKLTLGVLFLAVCAALAGIALFRFTGAELPAILASLAGVYASIAAGMLTLMYGFKAEYQAKAANGNGAAAPAGGQG